MRYYIGLAHKDDGSAFGLQFPDLPGVFSAADDLEALVANAAEALALFAEDGKLPEPRSIDQLNRDHSVANELARGAFLIAVPFIENDAAVVRANISLERGMLRAIDAYARACKMSRSAFIAQAARHEIEGRRTNDDDGSTAAA